MESSQLNCKEPLGMENGAITDKQVTASSSYHDRYNPARGRLHLKASLPDPLGGGAWVAKSNNMNQWFQIDVGIETVTVKMVATQGRDGVNQWVKMYKLQYSYSADGGSFQNYSKNGQTISQEFVANADSHSVVFNELNPPIRARLIRFQPTAWKNNVSMRVELYGCQDLCRTFHLSQPIEGFALVGHVIRNLAVEVESLCRVNCYMEADCVSFNIGSLQDGKYACEMSDSDHHTHPQDLVSWEGWIYGATIQNFCSTNTCHPENTLTCHSGFSQRGFRCLCKAGYYGSDCEKVALWVDASPKINITQTGSRVNFLCNATGEDTPTVTWTKSRGHLPTSSSVDSDGTLIIPTVEVEDSGSYLCTASNAFTTLASSVELKVFCSLVIVSDPVGFADLYVGQGLRLSCPIPDDPRAVLTWMFNDSVSLPAEASVETSNTLFIPYLVEEHTGRFSCLTKDSLQWNTTVFVKFPETCTIIKQTVCDVSGFYVIDPDGEQGQAPFSVYCNMTDKEGVGVTAVSHDSEKTTLVKGFERKGSYKRDINYNNVSLAQIKGLIEHSMECQQSVEYKCKHSILSSFSNDQVPFAWWVSRDGENMMYWDETSSATPGCACSVTETCADPIKRCNCDKNDFEWRKDSGILTNKSHLPVIQLRFGDTGSSNEEGYHTLGKLECYGTH
ncbi:contactin-associated protein like 5-3-like isoform X2 [Montipora capricornis]|uniref:contactin-associated protein like 5-3-like isoform X2 n=1 Tax=Montipora capricornis TaxID=246305 RepID=UPI0035F13ED9